jgi:arylsulfatase A-like enzyme
MSTRPNILFIMSDDHAAHAMSCYGSRINQTPNLDRIAEGGLRFDNCFVTNSICTPSRAAILTGTYNHVNCVTTLATHIDNRLPNVAKHLQHGGYQTAMVGKWHLGQGPQHCPTGFDYWNVLPGQGAYHDPVMIENGEEKQFDGYVTDIITDKSIDWLDQREADKPFFLMCHHKAPHRSWQPAERYADLYEDETIPTPLSFDDDYSNRAKAAAAAKMRMSDLSDFDLKQPVPEGLTEEEEKHWRYQRYIKDYLRCVAAIDENVGRLLDYLDAEGLTENTLIIYTSDQGFFLGDHGWFDKRFMYEESLRMPFIARFPQEIEAGSTTASIATNVDFAQTFLDVAGLPQPSYMQGRSLRELWSSDEPADWQQIAYHRYWMNADGCHNCYAHYGVRDARYKLIYWYNEPLDQAGALPCDDPPEWELFDLEKDPLELFSVYGDPAYAEVQAQLLDELDAVQARIGDIPQH